MRDVSSAPWATSKLHSTMTPLEPDTPGSEPNGTFDVRYIAFLQTLTHLRTLLHSY